MPDLPKIDRRIQPTDASILAYELRDFHRLFVSLKHCGYELTPEGMPLFLDALDQFATRAERILAVEDATLDREDLQGGLARVDALIDAVGSEARALDELTHAHAQHVARLEGIASGKVVPLRRASVDVASGDAP